MSGQATINVVDDEDMSSQGSVNAPVAPQQPSVQQGPAAMQLTEVVGTPVQWHPTMTQQSGVAGRSGSPAPTVPVQSTQVVAAPTVPVDCTIACGETKQAFDEVSSVVNSEGCPHRMVRSARQNIFVRDNASRPMFSPLSLDVCSAYAHSTRAILLRLRGTSAARQGNKFP